MEKTLTTLERRPIRARPLSSPGHTVNRALQDVKSSILCTRSQLRSVLLLLATAACADKGDRQSPEEGSPTLDAIVHDSAGIRIIESSAPVWDGDGWRVSDTPSVVIGRREEDDRYLFGSIGGGVVLRDGRIAVLDRLAAVIRVYSPKGTHIEDWGRTGEGPGEFTAAEGLFPYRGDSLLVSGSLASRFHVFDHAGRFGRRAAPHMQLSQWYYVLDIVERGSIQFAFSCCQFRAPLPTGAVLLSTPEMIPNTGSGMKRSSVLVALVPDTGGVADSVAVFNGGRYLPGQAPGGLPSGFHFQPSLRIATGPKGFFVTEGDSYSISAYDASGQLRRIIRLAREPRPITEEARGANENEIRNRILGFGNRLEGGSPEEVIERVLSAPYPTHLPTFEWLHVDPEGNVWAGRRRYGARDDMDEFFVFAEDGRYLGIVEVPAKLSVLQIGTDFILAQSSDDLDVQYVHLYRIGK